MDLAKLKKLEAEASAGPWEADDLHTEDGGGSYRAWVIYDQHGNPILDTSNSAVQEIHDDRGEGPDGPEGSRWDEVGRKDVNFIAEMRNSTPALIGLVGELRDALESAYRCITQPTAVYREAGSVMLATYRRTSDDYNALTAKMRAALTAAGSK